MEDRSIHHCFGSYFFYISYLKRFSPLSHCYFFLLFFKLFFLFLSYIIAEFHFLNRSKICYLLQSEDKLWWNGFTIRSLVLARSALMQLRLNSRSAMVYTFFYLFFRVRLYFIPSNISPEENSTWCLNLPWIFWKHFSLIFKMWFSFHGK